MALGFLLFLPLMQCLIQAPLGPCKLLRLAYQLHIISTRRGPVWRPVMVPMHLCYVYRPLHTSDMASIA